MNVIDIKDLGIKYVNLKGGKYLVDGEVIEIEGYRNNSKVQVKDINNIRKISEDRIIIKYIKGEEEMSVDEYTDKKNELLKNRIWDEEYEEYAGWEDLESEYEYKKLTTYWKPIYKDVQTISEPLKVAEVREIVYDTDNKFIVNIFLNGNKDTSDIQLYEYRQSEARIHIVEEIFKSLGFTYEDNISYMRTEGRKVWSNSTHSGIRYVTAFGTYLFNDSYKYDYTPRGTLEDMRKKYQSDYDSIKKIIMTKYNRIYGRIDRDEFDFVKLLDDLNSIRSSIVAVDSKVKTVEDRRKAINKIDKLTENINSMFK